MEQREFDVVIVGARVAGTVLAARLAMSGCQVLLLDKASLPADTLSTHFFRGAGLVGVLQRLGVLEEVLSLGSPPLVDQYFYPGGADPVKQPAQDGGELGYALSVRRRPLDQILLERAASSQNVTLEVGVRFLEPLYEKGRVCGALLATTDGPVEVLCRLLVGADGRNSAVARALDAPYQRQHKPARAVYYCYIEGFPGPDGRDPTGAEFSLRSNELAYVFPSDARLSCIALSVDLPSFREMRRDYVQAFRRRLLAHPGLADRLQGHELGKVFGCGPEPDFVRSAAGDGWALVGDAGIHQDPWSGMGMDLAGLHAEMLAQELQRFLGGEVCQREALRSYHERRDDHALRIYESTVGLAPDLRALMQAQT